MDKAELARCALLLAMITLCWWALSGRVLDAAQVTFIYRDF